MRFSGKVNRTRFTAMLGHPSDRLERAVGGLEAINVRVDFERRVERFGHGFDRLEACASDERYRQLVGGYLTLRRQLLERRDRNAARRLAEHALGFGEELHALDDLRVADAAAAAAGF